MTTTQLYDVRLTETREFQFRAPLKVIGQVLRLHKDAIRRIEYLTAKGEGCPLHFPSGNAWRPSVTVFCATKDLGTELPAELPPTQKDQP